MRGLPRNSGKGGSGGRTALSYFASGGKMGLAALGCYLSQRLLLKSGAALTQGGNTTWSSLPLIANLGSASKNNNRRIASTDLEDTLDTQILVNLQMKGKEKIHQHFSANLTQYPNFCMQSICKPF